VVRTLLQMGEMSRAYAAYSDGLNLALLLNLEANAEILSLLRPFFASNWTLPTADIDDNAFAYLANDVAMAFRQLGQLSLAHAIHEVSTRVDLKLERYSYASIGLLQLALTFSRQNHLAKCDGYTRLALELAELTGDDSDLYPVRLSRFEQLAETGRW